MRIGPTIPFHIARAYGIQPATRPSPVNPQSPVAPSGDVRDIAATKPSEGLNRLIGGAVARSVDFDSASSAQNLGGPVLQLYTRAADRIEAATGVHLGRNLDISG